MLLALDGIQDPQTLGSICRSAEAAGVAGIVIPRHRSAEITPAVAKASAGAVEHLRVSMVKRPAQALERVEPNRDLNRRPSGAARTEIHAANNHRTGAR